MNLSLLEVFDEFVFVGGLFTPTPPGHVVFGWSLMWHLENVFRNVCVWSIRLKYQRHIISFSTLVNPQTKDVVLSLSCVSLPVNREAECKRSKTFEMPNFKSEFFLRKTS